MAMRMYPADYPWDEVPSRRSRNTYSVAPSPGTIPTGVVSSRTHRLRVTMYDGGRRRFGGAGDPRAELEERLREEARRLFPNSVRSQEWYVRTQLERLAAQGALPAPPTAAADGGHLDEYLTEYQSAYDEARQANEGRYQDILAQLDKMGAQERADIRARYAAARSGGLHDLVQRGLMGTTLAPSLRALYAREETADEARLNERLREARLGFMERRTDTYPEESTMLNLAQGAGRYGAYGSRPGTPGPGQPAPLPGAAPVRAALPAGAGTVICPVCNGTGYVNGRIDPHCGGTGRMPATSTRTPAGGYAPPQTPGWSSLVLPGSNQPVRPPGPLGPVRPQDRTPARSRIRLYGGIMPVR